MKNKLEWANADHSVWVHEDCDWGGPCEYTPMCRCGWRGTPVDDVLHIDGTGELGTRYSAFAEALDHVGLTVLDWINESEQTVSGWLKHITLLVEYSENLRANIQNMRHLA